MVQFQGFETLKEAQEFKKSRGGGLLCHAGHFADDYKMCVLYGGLNAEKYPYCVQWNITEMGPK